MRERDPIQCVRHMHPIAFVFVLELVCVKDRLCERARDSYSVRVSGSMRVRQKERGELKWSLSNPRSAWEATSRFWSCGGSAHFRWGWGVLRATC